MPNSPPDALLLIAPGCGHCPAVLEGLTLLLKSGKLGRLEVVNILAHPESRSTDRYSQRTLVSDWSHSSWKVRRPLPNWPNGPDMQLPAPV